MAPQPVVAAGPAHQLALAPFDATAMAHNAQLGSCPAADALQAAPAEAGAQQALLQSEVR